MATFYVYKDELYPYYEILAEPIAGVTQPIEMTEEQADAYWKAQITFASWCGLIKERLDNASL